MDPRTQERVEEWDSRPFNGGFDGLSDLAAADFSGAVSAAGTWLFMLNGRIVGVFDGDIEDFETASGTQYEAPHPSLPLLCTMEERGGETRANYYTNETPLREVDNTLQSGSFTGYVELSENVLSGDYYAVYYGGRRMAAAYIGNAERLLTGDEAFDRAADEVGIYEVVDVEIEVTDVPGTGGAEPDSSGSDRATADGNDDDAIDTGAAGSSTVDDTDAEPSADPTTSSIDPIDVSSTDTADAAAGDPIEDVTADDSALTGDIDLTGDASGITATEETEVESESASPGITEAEPSLDSDPTSQAESTASDESVESVDRNGNDEPEVSDETDSSSTTGVETEFSEADATADAAAGDASDGDSEPIESEPETDEVESPTDPDLAEVEAAAEELDRNISWVEEDDEPDVNAASTVEGSTTDESDAGSAAEPESDEDDLEEQFEREEEWRETRRIPSIDPDDSDSDADSSSGGGNARTAGAEASTGGQSDSRGGRPADSASTASRASGRGERSQAQSRGRETAQSRTKTAEQGNQEQVAALTEKVETLQEQRDALVAKAEELEAERDRLRSENEDLSATVERLQSRIESLETDLEQARTRETETGAGAADASAGRGTHLSPQQALSGTNLFVRYASKSQPTLETAHDGAADRSEVASNLRLEHHTQFDSADAVVDGEPYGDFLASTMEYRFVDWLTEMVLYEIRDTGNADGLGDLYDAIPRIDRAELGATISLEDDDTEDVPNQVTFDIVAFDKMGNPLVLATLNDSREPASKALLEELEEAASAVKANYPSLAAAIAVTSSYFEPGALEVTEQATSGGLLSRGSKLSYVNLSRKEGYHLCLAESRSEGFHMNVPEL
ncbi:transcriptional regulator [Natrinema sp. 1APR25-10V2]|uniref:DUF7527 domain-containing protein n=1 Tax=Natrinema sp. 1APR25-10V2 TaxID=2951081 RepID=UPI002876355E|nr:transcriptional regulator [Natrinema sp. 1APR25-10V2]MDS0474319.1 transcriptional regulator [Natrinema sp. 1APR25-10V2]